MFDHLLTRYQMWDTSRKLARAKRQLDELPLLKARRKTEIHEVTADALRHLEYEATTTEAELVFTIKELEIKRSRMLDLLPAEPMREIAA